jgi:hypothetical protein
MQRNHYLIRGGVADSVVADGIAGRDEVDRLIADLYELASDKRSFVSHPRVVQSWGCRPLS